MSWLQPWHPQPSISNTALLQSFFPPSPPFNLLSPLKIQRRYLGLVPTIIQSTVCQNSFWDLFKRNLKGSGITHAFSYGKCFYWAALLVLQKENISLQWYLAPSFTNSRYSPPYKSYTLGWAWKAGRHLNSYGKLVFHRNWNFILINDNWWYQRQCWIWMHSVLEMWAVVPFGVNSLHFLPLL